MITTYLQGGLGNQIFQITAALNHAKKHNDTAVFDLDNSHTPLQGENISKYKGKLFQYNHMSNIYDKCTNTFVQPSHGYCEIPYQENQQLQGYFQSEKFFIEYKDEIIDKLRNNLKFGYLDRWNTITNHLEHIKNMYNKPVVSIHIRRGDYLRFSHIHTPCSVDYYNEAMKIMKEKMGDFHAYFISDDIEWCREVFDGHGSFSKYNDEIDDLILMSNCDHHIIANSSFSWWGAYLNTSDNKVVIGPKKWFGVGGPQDQEDIIPESWIKI